jgi:membrane protein involved in colicin uptake
MGLHRLKYQGTEVQDAAAAAAAAAAATATTAGGSAALSGRRDDSVVDSSSAGVATASSSSSSSSSAAPSPCGNITTNYFTGAVKDNFAAAHQQEPWDAPGQRYFVNDQYWGGPGSPVFVYVLVE